jgi:hypothetical protein
MMAGTRRIGSDSVRRLIRIYDTTLRDGTQGEGVAFSIEDKLRIASWGALVDAIEYKLRRDERRSRRQ